MKYKMIVLDLDGTTLTSDYKVSDTLRNCISQLKKKLHVYIATGRSVSDSIAYFNILDFNNELIANNGSFVYKPTTGETFINSPMGNALEVLTYLFYNKEWFHIDNIVVSAREKTFLLNKKNHYLHSIIVNPSLPYYYIDSCSFLQLENVHRIIISIDSAYLNQLTSILKSLFPYMLVCHWHKRNDIIDISIKHIDKWTAILNIAESHGIVADEIVAIGDSDNDLSMLSSAGLGICMLNGTNSAKEAADLITDYDNNQDGVFKILTKIFSDFEMQEEIS
jgi:Cof subfamily protein (haloacid dehalogenase superfamily)